MAQIGRTVKNALLRSTVLTLAAFTLACGAGGDTPPSLSSEPSASKSLTSDRQSIAFGNVPLNGSSSQQFTIRNSGTADVSVTAVTASGLGFSVSSITLPAALRPTESRTFTVTFAPAAASTSTGAVAVSSDATSSPTIQLSGTGAEQRQVELDWDASTSIVAGYRIYRGSNTGGPYQLVSGLEPSLTFLDSVAAGSTYRYVVTAVDDSGIESIFSNEATVVVP